MPRGLARRRAPWPGALGTALALLARLPWAAGGPAAPQLPFEYSRDLDLYNQGAAVQYFEERFYRDGRGALSDEELQQVDGLARRALEEPVLALAAAQVLYMFGWFRESGQVLRRNVAAAAQLFERSIAVGGCEDEGQASEWMENACDVRWMHSALLYSWLAETEGDAAQSRSYQSKATDLLHGLLQLPRYAGVAGAWASPLQMNFNAIKFPGKPSWPIWGTDSLPIGKFLEEHHHVFKSELEAILNDPRDLYTQLARADPSREHLATPGGWHTVRVVRYHHWYDLFCALAPRTCKLVQSRPEIQQCSFMNVNYVKLYPGAHLKPHFGNGPRLSAHLSVIAPEPLRAGMSVGLERTLWVEGQAVIFDDTYPHCVSHWGTQPRYVMLVWFCHPCDESNEHGQTCPSAL